jgi:copper chaperone CopZ
MDKKIYKVEGMDCASCAKMIELDLEDAGINAKCDYGKEELTVEADNIGLLEEKISQIVGGGGYKLIKNGS